MVVLASQGISAEAAPDNASMTYVMLLNPECDWDFRDEFEGNMRITNTEYENYLDTYSVICLGGVKHLGDIEDHVLPRLRLDMPNDKFVFVYPESMVEQFHDYLEGKYGSEFRYLALGNSDVPNGIGYVGEVPANVKHEMAHLATCATWHDEQGENIGMLARYPHSERFPWCPAQH